MADPNARCGATVETMKGDAYTCQLEPHSRDEQHRDGDTTWFTAPNETRPERIGNEAVGGG